jgi:hypothetical protein
MIFLTFTVFSVALAASIGVILFNISSALPRIAEIIEAEFAPTPRRERQINFGAMKQHQALHHALRTADVVAFPAMARAEQEFKLAA